MAKAKSKKIVKKTSKKVSGKKVVKMIAKSKVDNRLSIAVLVLAILIFVLAALSMGR